MRILPFLFVFFFSLSCFSQNSPVRPSKNQEYKEKREKREDRRNKNEEKDNISIENDIILEETEDIIVEVDVILQENQKIEDTLQIKIITEIIDTPKVRILLHKNQSSRNFSIYGKARIASQTHRINIASGTLKVSFVDKNTAEISAFWHSAKIALPCTLSVVSGEKIFSDSEKKYRGSIIFTGENQGFSVINYIAVEDYLRGVVPLEIGVRQQSDFEALKAQAVAARTYTLARVLKNFSNDYDLLPTVADQVYGGSNCEYELSDSAVLQTQGIVIVKNDGELVNAFYHATCAGKTAAIDEVWRSQPDNSLVSRSDLRADGTAFCSFANSYSWKETWTINQFSEILRKYSRLSNEMPFDGIVKQVSVVSRTPSGRVAELLVVSDKGTFRYGKDKVRFVMRTPTKDEGILKSARFDIKIENNHVIATGFGYGHGIGMCQNGALSRAKVGQNYSEILKAYYTDIDFSDWNEVLIENKN